jgi:hypothetical protein
VAVEVGGDAVPARAPLRRILTRAAATGIAPDANVKAVFE